MTWVWRPLYSLSDSFTHPRTHFGGVYYLLTHYLLVKQFGEQFSLLTLDSILAQENHFSNQLWCSLDPSTCPPTSISSCKGYEKQLEWMSQGRSSRTKVRRVNGVWFVSFDRLWQDLWFSHQYEGQPWQDFNGRHNMGWLWFQHLWSESLSPTLIKLSQQTRERLLWCLLLCIKLTGHLDAQIFGYIQSLCASEMLVLDELNIWISRPNKANCHTQCEWASAISSRPE